MEKKWSTLLFLLVTIVLIVVGVVVLVLDYRDGIEITFASFLPIISLLISGGLFFNSYFRNSRK